MAKVRKDEPLQQFNPMAEDSGPVVLKVPPKYCAACGGKFIPHGKNTKYCPMCRRLPQARREAMRDARILDSVDEGKPEAVVYIDETKKRKQEETMKGTKEVEKKPDPEDFTPIEAAPVDELEEIAAELPKIRLKDAIYYAMLQLIKDQYGIDLIDASELMQGTLTVDGKEYGGIYIRRSAWEGV